MSDGMVCPFSTGGPGTICKDGTIDVFRKESVPCRAWVHTEFGCRIANQCEDCDTGPCGMTCPKRVNIVVREGYCKLLK